MQATRKVLCARFGYHASGRMPIFVPQKVWSPVKTIARLARRTVGRSGGLAHEFAPAQHRISSIRCLISTCSRSARFHLVSNEQWKYREQWRRGSGAMLVCRRRPSGRIKSRKKRKENFVHLFFIRSASSPFPGSATGRRRARSMRSPRSPHSAHGLPTCV